MRTATVALTLTLLVAACAPAPTIQPTGTHTRADIETEVSTSTASVGATTESDTSPSPAPTNVRVEDDLDYSYSPLLAFDSIRPVYEPEFAPAASAPLVDEELIIGIALGGEARAYPITVLRFREMVNDQIGQTPVLVTW